MTSTLVKANLKGKTPTQMIENLKSYNKYTATPHTEAELAAKAAKLNLVDGLPFTYCTCDDPAYGNSVITLDLRSLEGEYNEIYQLCERLAPHSPLIGTPLYKPHAFRSARKSGLTRLTELLCNQLGFIHAAVTTVEHAFLHDNQSIVEAILELDDSREKMQLMGKLSTLTSNFRRNYFADIPFLLEIVAADKAADFYLYDYKGSFDDRDLTDDEAIELLATEDLKAQAKANGIERARLKALGVEVLEPDLLDLPNLEQALAAITAASDSIEQNTGVKPESVSVKFHDGSIAVFS